MTSAISQCSAQKHFVAAAPDGDWRVHNQERVRYRLIQPRHRVRSRRDQRNRAHVSSHPVLMLIHSSLKYGERQIVDHAAGDSGVESDHE